MKIVIIDDEVNIANLISKNLQMEGYETFVAFNGDTGVNLVKTINPDIVILDIMLPDKSGYEVLNNIHSIDDSIPIIFLSALDSSANKILGLEIGADDYITKPFDNKELVSRVKALYRRMYKNNNETSDNNILKYKFLEIDIQKHTILLDGEKIDFTSKEFSVLSLLASNENRVYTREQLIEEVWGLDYYGNTRSVDVLITRIRNKLGIYQKYVSSIYGVGYKFEEIDIDENFKE